MKHCLVVDDSSVIRKIARQILEELDFTISEAGDGKVALDRCREGMPDAILLDWNMPVMNGLDLLTARRDESDGDRPVVVFCTTENDMEHIAQAISAGADEYVMKPFDGEILESKLAEAGVV